MQGQVGCSASCHADMQEYAILWATRAGCRQTVYYYIFRAMGYTVGNIHAYADLYLGATHLEQELSC